MTNERAKELRKKRYIMPWNGKEAVVIDNHFDKEDMTKERIAELLEAYAESKKYSNLADCNGTPLREGDRLWCEVRDEEDKEEYEGVHWLIWGKDLQWQIWGTPDSTHGLPFTWNGWKSITKIKE